MAGVDGEGRRSKRARARAMKAAHHAVADGRAGSFRAEPGSTRGCPRPCRPTPKQIEYRLQVKPVGHAGGAGSGLTITLLNPENRVPPPAERAPRGAGPAPDAGPGRDPLARALREPGPAARRDRRARGRRERSAAAPEGPARDRRAADDGAPVRRRAAPSAVRPRALARTAGRSSCARRFSARATRGRFTTTSGAWFEGSPGWYVDAQEGWARPIDRRVSPAAVRRLLRLPVITEPVDRLAELVMHGLPKVALEVGAELPELSQVADVVDLEPTFRVAAGGTLVEAQVSLRAAYEDVEIDVRADGMTLPVIVKAPPAPTPRPLRPRARRRTRRRASRRARRRASAPSASGATSRRSKRPPRSCATWGWSPTKTATSSSRAATTPSASGPRASRRCPSSGTSSSPTTSSTCTCATRRSRRTRAWRAASTGCRLRLNFESEGVAVTQDELARCLADGRKYVRLADGTFARIDPAEGPRGPAAPGRDPGDGRRQRRATAALAGRTHRGPARAGGALERHRATRRTSSRSSRTSTRSRARASRATSRRSSARTRSRAFTGSGFSTRSAAAASWPTTWASARRCRRWRSCSP